jgi:hypothetical protein
MSRGFQFSMSIVDEEGLVPSYHTALLLNLQAAIENWGRYIKGLGTIEVELVIDHSEIPSGGSKVSAEIGSVDNITVYREGVAHELLTGIDPNGNDADAIIYIGAEYLKQWFWLDPNPFKRTGNVPSDKEDILSTLMHEFGHALGMNGWKGADGVLPGEYQSVYDSHIVIQNGNPYFTGAAVAGLYGGLLPLSNPLVDMNTVHHYGHEPDDMLDYGLMEGNTYFFTGRRYYIDNIDLAIMKDLGLATSGRAESEFDDYLTGYGQNDSFSAGAGNDTLSGGAGNDKLYGGSGNDRVNGGLNNDLLMGSAGKDAFVFTTKLGTSKTDRKVNFDTITDFKAKDDSINLDNAIFKKLGKKGSEQKPAKLEKKFFTVGDKAKDKDDYIIYNKKTGVLSYDADGSGKGQAVEFALFTKKPTLKVDDFFVI